MNISRINISAGMCIICIFTPLGWDAIGIGLIGIIVLTDTKTI